MPIYTFKCSNGHTETHYAKIIERDAIRQCASCGANLLRILEAPAVRTDISPYQSPVDGRWIDSRAARREDLKRHGCIEWEPGIRQDLPRLRQEAQDKAFEPIAKGIEEVASGMIAAGKMDSL